MSCLAEALAAAAQDLDEIGASWALVGGLAVSVWCDPRLTRDIDVAVSVRGDKDAEHVVANCSNVDTKRLSSSSRKLRRAWPPLFRRF